jgi:hypothetical protein
MSALEFVAAMTKALAWPTAAVVVAVLFRTQLRALLSAPARRVKAGPLEIEWDRTVAEAQVELDQPGLTTASLPPAGPVSAELGEVAERSPTAAVMEAHATIERELRQLLIDSGVPDNELRVGATGLARIGVDRGVVTKETLNAVEGISVLRNLAAHGRAGDVSTDRAGDYLALADAVLYAIRNKA